MDAREKLLGSIEERLTAYASWINQGGGIRSVGAEYLYCDLLNEAFDYELKNMNRIRDNFPAIDLGDEEERLAVQVTSTGDAGKVKKTLERFYDHNLNVDYNRLIVLIAGKAECRSTKTPHPGLDVEIWGTAELVKEFRDRLSMKTLKAVDAFLLERVDVPKMREPVLHLPIGETLGLGGFIGRKQELQKMNQALSQGVKPLVLFGLGGMGKTELARYFGAQYNAGTAYYVNFRDSFRDTITKNIARGISGVWNAGLTDDETFGQTLSCLKRSEKTDLLIIDNVDCDNGKYADLKDEAYHELCNLPLRLLFTTRFAVHRAIEVGRLENGELYRIFENHGVSLSKKQMDELINEVDGHTMTVDLMARTMVGSWKRVKPHMLMDALRKQNLNHQKYSAVETDYNRSHRQEQIYGHLRTVFNVAGIPPSAKDALRCAVLLPADGMDSEVFGSALSQESQNILDDLISHGWLHSDERITIHPVIRLVCKTELTPTEENCDEFLEKLWKQYEEMDYDLVVFQQIAMLLSTVLGLFEDTDNKWFKRAIGILKTLCDGQRGVGDEESARVFELHAMWLTEKNRNDTTGLSNGAKGSDAIIQDLDEIYTDMGITYGYLGDNARTMDYQYSGHKLWEDIDDEKFEKKEL